MWHILPAVPLSMKIAGKLIQIKGNSMGLMGQCRPFQQPGIKSKTPHEGKLARVLESIEGRIGESFDQSVWILREVGQHLPHVAEHGPSTGMAVLNIENRIVARLLDHLG